MTTLVADVPPPAVQNRVTPTYRNFAPGEVRLLDGPFRQAQDASEKYLLSLEADRLLSGFRTEAGLEPKARKYGGWEMMGIAGHSLGHYLTGCAYMYSLTGNAGLLERMNYIVDELALCQEKNADGYLCAFPKGRDAFAEVRAGNIRAQSFDLNGIWVPWYTIHKQLAGLRDVYVYTGNRKALDIALRNADWAIELTKDLTDEQWQKMLSCEHGGMNEVLADLYAITGQEKYKALSLKFYHSAVLDPLTRGENVLPGIHGNTQIPKLIGLSRLYELTGEEKYKSAASFFWNTVIDTQSYANGGNTSNEYFGRPHTQGARVAGNTSETCNTYNMLKLAGHLYGWQPSMKLADWAERATFNHILASQNPETGMMIYYALLGPASKKNWSTPTESFWCCVGTGMENHARYGHWIYSKGAGVLAVNQFIASEARWAEGGVTLRQETRFPEEPRTKLSVKTGGGAKAFTLRLRYPSWATAEAKITINGKAEPTTGAPGTFIDLKRTWNDGDTVELALPMALHDEALPDMPERRAIFYGPILLAGQVEQDKARNPALITGGKPVAEWLKPAQGELMFTTHAVGKPADVTLRPLYEITEGNYNVYWDLFTQEQWAAREAAYRAEQERIKELEARTVDTFTPGEQQPEVDRKLTSEKSRAGENFGRKWRDAHDGGWFEFSLKVDPAAKNELILTYYGSDAGGREFDVIVDGKTIATEELNARHPEKFFDVAYPIDPAGKESVRVRLQAHPGKVAGGMYGVRMVRPK